MVSATCKSIESVVCLFWVIWS